MLKLTCPHCRRRLTGPASQAGKKGRCPCCRAVFRLPADWYARLMRRSNN